MHNCIMYPQARQEMDTLVPAGNHHQCQVAAGATKRTDKVAVDHGVSAYPYDLEVFRLSDLKRRSTEQAMRRTYCYEFYMLICVTEGQCMHFVDFEPMDAVREYRSHYRPSRPITSEARRTGMGG